MTTTAYTVHRLIFAHAPVQPLACQLSQVADPDGWANEWSVPLRKAADDTNAAEAYWCCWTMTDAQRQALDGAIASSSVSPPATAAEKQVYRRSDVLPFLSANQRIVICDAEEWGPDDALAALGLDRIDAP